MRYLKTNMASALMTFVEVGKQGSLTRAAKAKCLTTSAISQQLLQLENNIGVQLLERHSRGVRFPEAGQRLHQTASASFQDIDNVLASLQETSLTPSEIKLKLTPSFALKWLIPRLEDFHRLYPDIQVQSYAEGALVDHTVQDFDLAIDYGPIPYRDSGAKLLMEEKLIPVMSPHYWEKYTRLNTNDAQTWHQVTLLHDAKPWSGAIRQHEWQSWAQENGVDISPDRGHFFNRTDMAMSAAEAGVGIALARQALIQDELETGRLVAPFAEIGAGAGYFLLAHTQSPAGRCFTKWLHSQVLATTTNSES